MTRRKPSPRSARRSPKQARSRETIHLIFEATTQILLREGPAKLNTNHLAARAGISVGTLYQYFPNKRSILVAMARRELDSTIAAIESAIASAEGDTADPVRLTIRTLIAAFRKHRRARLITFQTLMADGLEPEIERRLDEIARLIVRRAPDARVQGLSPQAAFVLTRAVNGVLVSAAQDGSPHLGSVSLEDDLVRLVHGFLGRDAARPDD
jgi:AcrR family transcriptional regulator